MLSVYQKMPTISTRIRAPTVCILVLYSVSVWISFGVGYCIFSVFRSSTCSHSSKSPKRLQVNTLDSIARTVYASLVILPHTVIVCRQSLRNPYRNRSIERNTCPIQEYIPQSFKKIWENLCVKCFSWILYAKISP